MAWGVQHAKCNIAQPQYFPIVRYVSVKLRLGAGAIYNCRAGAGRQVDVTGDKVCVEVGFKYIPDGDAIGPGPFQVRLHFAQWIDDGGFLSRTDVIGTLCQASGVDLFDFHSSLLVMAQTSATFY